MKKVKVKNIVLILIVIINIKSIFAIGKAYSKTDINYKLEYASTGDTLWEIAERESKNNKYYRDKDVRYIIYDLKQINNLSSSSLQVGQEIKIPKI